MYGNFLKKRDPDDISEAAKSSLSKSNLAKLPDLTPGSATINPKADTGITTIRSAGGSRRQILSKILDRLCDLDSNRLLQIQSSIAGSQQPGAAQDEEDPVEDIEAQVIDPVGDNAMPEEQQEFEVDQL